MLEICSLLARPVLRHKEIIREVGGVGRSVLDAKSCGVETVPELVTSPQTTLPVDTPLVAVKVQPRLSQSSGPTQPPPASCPRRRWWTSATVPVAVSAAQEIVPEASCTNGRRADPDRCLPGRPWGLLPGRPRQSGFPRSPKTILVRGLCASAEAFLGNRPQRRVLQRLRSRSGS